MPLDFSHESNCLKTFHYVIGVDEAGRGPLAGPVVAGAFCFFKACNDVRQQDPAALSFVQEWPWRIVGDSKTLAENVRETIYDAYLQLARRSEVREADVSTLADASTADGSLEAIPRPDGELEVTVSSEGDPMSCGSVEVEVVDQKRAAPPSPLFDHYTDIYFDFAVSEPTEIDRVNILEASLRSMTRAVYRVIKLICQRHTGPEKKLRFKVLVDGNRHPHLLESGMLLTPTPPSLLCGDEGTFISREEWKKIVHPKLGGCDNQPIVKGDGLVLSIAAGSIVAKVVRDRIMRQLSKEYPDYGLEVHKGYPTPAHDALVRRLGPTPIHRLSFAPIYEMLSNDPSKVPPGRDFEEVKNARQNKKKRKESSQRPTKEASQRHPTENKRRKKKLTAE